jgi:catechol 2,3-dioxygenase-like lactoylglutathione lyase family enzyme
MFCLDIRQEGPSMTVHLNHTIVGARDKRESAVFLSEVFDLPAPEPSGPFLTVKIDEHLTFDYADWGDEIQTQHYAFLVDEAEFDEIFGRVRSRELPYWPDPHRSRPGEINTHDGGRGVYFEDPGGHLLEIITRPYGGGG